MREIVDRYYVDNWVVVYGVGLIVDLLTEWESYEAASTVMRNAVMFKVVRELIDNVLMCVGELKMVFKIYFIEGVFIEEFVLSNEKVFMNVVRDVNVVARFVFLYNLIIYKLVLFFVFYMLSKENIIDLFLDCVELENELKKIYILFLSGKYELWEKCKYEVGERMKEFSVYFGGIVGLSRNVKDENLWLWFVNLFVEVE